MTISLRALGVVAAVMAASACDEKFPSEELPSSIDTQLRQVLGQYGVVPIGPVAPQNPAQVELGRALMFDKLLSGNRDIACATCHTPTEHATDGLPLAIGTGGTGEGPARALGPGRAFVPRNVPTLLNSGLGMFYVFWDGRLNRFGPPVPEAPVPLFGEHLLQAQAMLPVLNRREMRGEPGDVDVFGNPNELAAFGDAEPERVWQAVMQRLLAIPAYVSMFRAAFPSSPPSSLSFREAATAMAAFQIAELTRTDSPFDRYLKRDDNALAPDAKRGALLFFGDAGCLSCHNGPLLGGQDFANTGVPQLGPGVGRAAPLDKGRGELTNFEFYQFAFRVPPLRNVELTAPYFHDGAFPTLEAAVRHYSDVPKSLRTFDPATLPPAFQGSHHGDQRTIDTVLATLDFRLRRPLNLTDAQVADLVAFLKSLTDPAARDLSGIVPTSVPSGLPLR
jgi:cytochrome c peroxidase